MDRYDTIYSSAMGAGSSAFGMITGLLNVSTLAQALVLGFIGAVGGLVAKWLWRRYIDKK